jgi:hypothetical protein
MPAATRGMSKILTKQRKTILEISLRESGSGLRKSTILVETNDVDICRPMNTIRNKTAVRNADTLPGRAASSDIVGPESPMIVGRNTRSANAAINAVVRSLLIIVFTLAFETSCLTFLLLS